MKLVKQPDQIGRVTSRYWAWKQIQFDKQGKGEKFYWASNNKILMNRYKAPGINYMAVVQFDDLVAHLQDKIDKIIFRRNQKVQGKRNYSGFEEHVKGIKE